MEKTGLNIVITGGNSGIGLQTVRDLYLKGNNVIFGSRNQQKNQEAINSILNQEKAGILKNACLLKAFPLDLSKKQSILKFSKSVKQLFNHIDILINNAGLFSKELTRNQDGVQTTLATNHFGHFYLSYLFFDLIKKAPESRIINLSSKLHNGAPKNVLSDIQCKSKSFSTIEQYEISKFMNVLFTQELSRKIQKNSNIKTFAVHPGVVSTNFGSDIWYVKCAMILCGCIAKNTQQGAYTSIYLATQDLKKLQNGQYYHEKDLFNMDERARNPKLGQELWKMSEKIYSIKFDP